MSGRRALVAGATGLVGRELLKELLAATGPDGPRYRTVVALRRRRAGAAEVSSEARLRWLDVDFGSLPALPPHDDVYIALGTTIRQAGSEAAFRAVDLDAVLACARAARDAGASRLALVSALGADTGSRVFYNRVKGEAEAAVAGLGFERVVIAQPSLLVGDRAALGQPVRRAEQLGIRLLTPILGLVPASVRPIRAEVVARALVRALGEETGGLQRLPSAALQRLGARLS
jgi:uncharacterized protein YbjT (DUF2867 family)